MRTAYFRARGKRNDVSYTYNVNAHDEMSTWFDPPMWNSRDIWIARNHRNTFGGRKLNSNFNWRTTSFRIAWLEVGGICIIYRCVSARCHGSPIAKISHGTFRKRRHDCASPHIQTSYLLDNDDYLARESVTVYRRENTFVERYTDEDCDTNLFVPIKFCGVSRE